MKRIPRKGVVVKVIAVVNGLVRIAFGPVAVVTKGFEKQDVLLEVLVPKGGEMEKN